MARTFSVFSKGGVGRGKEPTVVISAESDAEALLEACKVVSGIDVEIWEGNRLVARIDCPAQERPKAAGGSGKAPLGALGDLICRGIPVACRKRALALLRFALIGQLKQEQARYVIRPHAPKLGGFLRADRTPHPNGAGITVAGVGPFHATTSTRQSPMNATPSYWPQLSSRVLLRRYGTAPGHHSPDNILRRRVPNSKTTMLFT